MILDPHNLVLKSLRHFKITMDKKDLEIILSVHEQIKLTGEDTTLKDFSKIEADVNEQLKK